MRKLSRGGQGEHTWALTAQKGHRLDSSSGLSDTSSVILRLDCRGYNGRQDRGGPALMRKTDNGTGRSNVSQKYRGRGSKAQGSTGKGI